LQIELTSNHHTPHSQSSTNAGIAAFY